MVVNYAEVIIENNAVQTDRPFTYKVDEDLKTIIKPGMRVIVPFGRGNKNIKGIVINTLENFQSNFKLKSILDIIDNEPIINRNLLELGKWISQHYLSSYLDGLKLVLPPGDYKKINTFVTLNHDITFEQLMNLNDYDRKVVEFLEINSNILLSDLKTKLNFKNLNSTLKKLEDKKIIEISISIDTKINKKYEKWVYIISQDVQNIKVSPKQKMVLEYLMKNGESSLKDLLKVLNITDSPIKTLVKKEILYMQNKEIIRNPVTKKIDEYKKHTLNIEQEHAFQCITKNMNKINSDVNTFLLHGVTGSGKTEIYLQLVEKMIAQGKETIILVPEISLTPQTIDRFIGRFKGEVAVLHSKLSFGERFDQWRMIREGKVKIVVGARSAIFAPFNRLGLIIIDESHEDSYKSSSNPKYDTIEVAKKRADLENSILILGTATPSIESYYKAKTGRYQLLQLENRVNNNFPIVEIIDMKSELENGNRTIFSKVLYESINKNLIDRKQTILFLNRRGFNSFVSCRSCGYVVKCPDCEVSMTYHKTLNRLKCHYCGKTKVSPIICPDCGSNYIKHFGIGTEQVEYLTRESFPMANIARMDADTMNEKSSYEKTLTKMKNKEIDILIGTQMVSKGLDFENVTLVGIIAADTTINLPDFRSSERSFQLTTQVAGRSGRSKDLGKVVVQTYQPSHYSLYHAKNHDYIGFYEEEINIRKAFNYPPFKELISILVYGENQKKVYNTINVLTKILFDETREMELGNDFVTGPYPAPLERIKNKYRYYLVLRLNNYNMLLVKNIINKIFIENFYKVDLDGMKINIDINPISIL